MVTSHGPEKNSSGQKDPVSEIELFNGEGLFKKKKRTYNRNSVVTSLNQELIREGVEVSAEIKQKRTINDEESLESVLELSVCRRGCGRGYDKVNFEIESVK